MRSSILILVIFAIMSGCSDESAITETAENSENAELGKRPDFNHDFVVSTIGPDGAEQRMGWAMATICHYSSEDESYFPLDLPNPSYSSHLDHGDGIPGGLDYSNGVSVFMDDCSLAPVAEPVLCSVEYQTTPEGFPLAVATAISTRPDVQVTQLGGRFNPGTDGIMDIDLEASQFQEISGSSGQAIGVKAVAVSSVATTDDLFVARFVSVDAQQERIRYRCGPYFVDSSQ